MPAEGNQLRQRMTFFGRKHQILPEAFHDVRHHLIIAKRREITVRFEDIVFRFFRLGSLLGIPDVILTDPKVEMIVRNSELTLKVFNHLIGITRVLPDQRFTHLFINRAVAGRFLKEVAEAFHTLKRIRDIIREHARRLRSQRVQCPKPSPHFFRERRLKPPGSVFKAVLQSPKLFVNLITYRNQLFVLFISVI